MKRRFSLLFATGLSALSLAAQSASPALLGSATGSGGAFNANGIDFKIFWSVGELSVANINGGQGQATQGFWQPEIAVFVEAEQPEREAYGLGIFPNPTAGALYLRVSGGKRVAYSLFGADGRELRCGEDAGDGDELSIAGLPAAVYFIRFSTMGGQWLQTLRVVKN